MKAHLVGGGLSSFAAAAYLIRDGGVLGNNITIYEARPKLGGSLGVAGSAETGYIYPGGRVFEWQYRCAMDLFAQVPSRSDASRSIREEIAEFNEHHSWYNKARLIDGDGKVVDTSRLGLGPGHHMQIARLILTPEALLDGKQIRDFVSEDFFQTNFWFIWSSIMAFVPEHSAIEMRRYMLRFAHLLPDLSTMTFILRTKYNQYQTIVEPLRDWLSRQGVTFLTDTFVSNVDFLPTPETLTANAIQYERDGERTTVDVASEDIVTVTAGSQLADMAVGGMDRAPEPVRDDTRNAFTLWRSLARGRKGFGRPEAFTEDIEHGRWVSFTVTCTEPLFAELMEDFSGREAGRGGLITFRDSNWLITIVRFHQPNVIGQPDDVFMWWGYAIHSGRPGNFVNKPMTECSGEEILREVLSHLHFDEHAERIIQASICIPCLMPHTSSVCLRRSHADRPPIVPAGSTNFAFLGQFCEQPRDVVFTMEYSVRSAWTAVHRLLKTDRPPPPVYKGQYSPHVMWRVAKALMA
jgi:oleate hydratase